MDAPLRDHKDLVTLIERAGTLIPDFAATEAEEDTLLTISRVRAGGTVSNHEVDAAAGYLERLIERSTKTR